VRLSRWMLDHCHQSPMSSPEFIENSTLCWLAYGYKAIALLTSRPVSLFALGWIHLVVFCASNNRWRGPRMRGLLGAAGDGGQCAIDGACPAWFVRPLNFTLEVTSKNSRVGRIGRLRLALSE